MGGAAPLETDEKEAKRRLERQSGSSYKGLVDHSKEFGFQFSCNGSLERGVIYLYCLKSPLVLIERGGVYWKNS